MTELDNASIGVVPAEKKPQMAHSNRGMQLTCRPVTIIFPGSFTAACKRSDGPVQRGDRVTIQKLPGVT